MGSHLNLPRQGQDTSRGDRGTCGLAWFGSQREKTRPGRSCLRPGLDLLTRVVTDLASESVCGPTPQFLVPVGVVTDGREILRKEVIQPQVPLRLPCYDLVPIAEFIFGA